jgi:hypothetical protein
MKYMTRKDWRNYVLGRSKKGKSSKKTSKIVAGWIETYLKESETAIGMIEQALKEAQRSQVDGALRSVDWEHSIATTLQSRWDKIKRLCEDALDAIT